MNGIFAALILSEPASSCWSSAACEQNVSLKCLREPSFHLTALRVNKGSVLMLPRSTACLSIERGAKMHRLLMLERSTPGRKGTSSKANAKWVIYQPSHNNAPATQFPLVKGLLLCCTHLSWCQQSKKKAGKRVVIRGRPKEQQRGKMLAFWGLCNHLWHLCFASWLGGPIWLAAIYRVSPSCCYFVVVIYLQKHAHEMSEGTAFLLVPEAARELLEGIVFLRWSGTNTASNRDSPAREQRESEARPSVGQTW